MKEKGGRERQGGVTRLLVKSYWREEEKQKERKRERMRDMTRNNNVEVLTPSPVQVWCERGQGRD